MLRLLPALCLLAAFPAIAQDADGEGRIVFVGDSITAGWSDAMPAFFEGKPYIERGIGGETTSQILARFRADVVDLEPAAVVILAGTNDIAGNAGEVTNKMIQDNLASMAEIATANDIRVILASILPASDYPWRPGLQPAGRIAAVNSWIRTYADENDHLYLDYYSALVNDEGGMQAAYTTDGVHVNAAGYAVMAGLAETSVAEALGEPRPEESSGGVGLNFRPLDGCPRTTSSKRPIDCD